MLTGDILTKYILIGDIFTKYFLTRGYFDSIIIAKIHLICDVIEMKRD